MVHVGAVHKRANSGAQVMEMFFIGVFCISIAITFLNGLQYGLLALGIGLIILSVMIYIRTNKRNRG